MESYNWRTQKWSLSDGVYRGWIGGGDSEWVQGAAPVFGNAHVMSGAGYGSAILPLAGGDFYLFRALTSVSAIVHYKQR